MKRYLIWIVAMVLMVPITISHAARDSWLTLSNNNNFINAKQFMTIPFSRSRLEINKVDYLITEWWRYSTGETSIHGFISHNSIDYAVPYGTPVYAPTDGWIHASYYNTTLWAIGKRKMYQGKTINYGLWYRVQLIHPDPNDPFNPSKVTFIQMAHLSRFAPRVAKTVEWLPYIYDEIEDALKINNYSLTSQDLTFILKGRNLRRAIHVEQWDLIWYVGNSWLEQGEEVDIWYLPQTYLKDPNNSRDEPHVHVQLYSRSLDGSKKPWSTKNIYNLWTELVWSQYPTHNNWLILTTWHLFKSMNGKLPDYAK